MYAIRSYYAVFSWRIHSRIRSAAGAFDRPSLFFQDVDEQLEVVSLDFNHAILDGSSGRASLFQGLPEFLEGFRFKRYSGDDSYNFV